MRCETESSALVGLVEDEAFRSTEENEPSAVVASTQETETLGDMMDSDGSGDEGIMSGHESDRDKKVMYRRLSE